ncbi:MAG: NHL repeat-containing protein [Candidatus Anstonellaceae archaeon]
MRWLMLLLLASLASANFVYLWTYNGTNPDESNENLLFSQPSAVEVHQGKLFVADDGRRRIYVMNATAPENTTQRIRIVDPQGEEAFANPIRLQMEGGFLYVADGNSGRIKYYTQEGSTVYVWNTATTIKKASGVVFAKDFAYIADQEEGRIVAYSRQTKSYSNIVVEKGGSDGLLSSPSDVRLYKDRFYVSDSAKKAIYVYSKDWEFEQAIGRGRGGVGLYLPRGIRLYEDKLYVADRNGNRIVVFTLDGYPVAILNATSSINFSYPEDIAVSDGKLYVADTGNRLVHVFAINFTTENDTVAQSLAMAKQEAEKLYALYDVAKKIGAEYESLSFDAELAEGEGYYKRMLYSSAENIASRVYAQAKQASATLALKIDVKIRQIVKGATDKFAAVRQKANETVQQQVDSQASKILQLLNAKDYAAASASALDFNQTVALLAKEIETQVANQANSEFEKMVQTLNSRKANIEYRLGNVKDMAQKYRQNINVTNLERLLAQASREISSGLFEAATQTLELAETETKVFENMLRTTSKEIDAVLQNISLVEFNINSSSSKSMLISPNLAEEFEMLKQAKELAYSNPAVAAATAAKIEVDAQNKIKEAQTLSIAAVAIIMMVGLVAAISAAVYIYVRQKKKENR